MLRKHINDDEPTPVKVVSIQPTIGPCPCPQPGCQQSDGEYPRQRGYVVYEEYGGSSGDYLTSAPCRCCDGKGSLRNGEKAYMSYCSSANYADILTPYPDPVPMSKQVYDEIKTRRRG